MDHYGGSGRVQSTIFANQAYSIIISNNAMQYLATLSRLNYLVIVDGSIVILLLLVIALIVYLTMFYDKLHPNEERDKETSAINGTPEMYFVNISPFTGMTGATTPAITKGNLITKRDN